MLVFPNNITRLGVACLNLHSLPFQEKIVRRKVRAAITARGLVRLKLFNSILSFLYGGKSDVIFYCFFFYVILVKNKLLINLIYLLFGLFDIFLQLWISFLLQFKLCFLYLHLKVIDTLGKINRLVKIFDRSHLHNSSELTHECTNTFLRGFGRWI